MENFRLYLIKSIWEQIFYLLFNLGQNLSIEFNFWDFISEFSKRKRNLFIVWNPKNSLNQNLADEYLRIKFFNKLLLKFINPILRN
jgi:hypothetical protein